MERGGTSVTELCRRFQISRKTAYKWLGRFRAGRLKGLVDQSRQPTRVHGRTSVRWLDHLRRLRLKRGTWGARKLRSCLQTEFGAQTLPSTAAIGRWLQRWGMTVSPRRRKRGPKLTRRPVRPARGCNDLWTVDFKGWFQTGDGCRVHPLTVRDLHSRYGLWIGVLSRSNFEQTHREFVKIFKRYGLPRRIRCDNGSPFGSGGPCGLTRLSLWWIRLGIEVEFITPGRPGENGAHEQFHRVYKEEIAKPPAGTVTAQKRRSARWLKRYNEERPHEALKMKVPAQIYRPSKRRFPTKLEPWKYPDGWVRRWVRGNGEITWKGTLRFVGEAFIRDHVALVETKPGTYEVRYGPLLVGLLHEAESGAIRPARYGGKRGK